MVMQDALTDIDLHLILMLLIKLILLLLGVTWIREKVVNLDFFVSLDRIGDTWLVLLIFASEIEALRLHVGLIIIIFLKPGSVALYHNVIALQSWGVDLWLKGKSV